MWRDDHSFRCFVDYNAVVVLGLPNNVLFYLIRRVGIAKKALVFFEVRGEDCVGRDIFGGNSL